MERSIKRKPAHNDASPIKKLRTASPGSFVKRDLLRHHYPHVQTLREYLLAKLPSSSRLRRRKLASLGHQLECSETDIRLSRLLDSCLVCSSSNSLVKDPARWEQWVSFSQRADESYITLSGGISGAIYSQSEIIDFAIWLLFSRETRPGRWPKHLLCDGFRRSIRDGEQYQTTIPGVYRHFPNASVDALKDTPWTDVLALLGRSGESIMIDLVVDCTIFPAAESGYHNYYQLSGEPLSETGFASIKEGQVSRTASEISLVRTRILYAKPTLTPGGLVQSGFKHIHALNRYSHRSITTNRDDVDLGRRNETNTIKVLMYMFPRQFRLHNVFTSEVDSSRTSQNFQDYTVRDDEVSQIFHSASKISDSALPKIPKRLRGRAKSLVRRFQVMHHRCSYIELLRHYCPCDHDRERSKRPMPKYLGGSKPASKPVLRPKTADCAQNRPAEDPKHRNRQSKHTCKPKLEGRSIVDMACSTAQVSAYCRAALVKLVPLPFWGDGKSGRENRDVFLRKVHHFISLRRFETMSLHELSQGFKLANISWLHLPSSSEQKPSQSETNKRQEIFLEFLYYVFDSLLIPLIRNSFYVTESNNDRYRLFYFRHDVWKAISEPALRSLRDNMFEEFKSGDHNEAASQRRRLGHSQIRLLPKRDSLRPITNLRKKQVNPRMPQILGPSINNILSPIHTVLKLERVIHPERLGSAMFSVGDIYWRLKTFRETLGPALPKLYFAKVDVQAAFDTIPQAAVMKLMKTITNQSSYNIVKHAEVRPGERSLSNKDMMTTKPIRRWHANALLEHDSRSFVDRVEDSLASKAKNTVFIGSASRKNWDTHGLLQLMEEHIEQNLIKVGKKLYRQKQGIPQGSVLSSFLCNYFYADLESRHLGFLQSSDCCLLRLIDDFLLITTNRAKAVQFVELMQNGVPDYGVTVSEKKTLVNFNLILRGKRVTKLDAGTWFPYCGTAIDCHNLNIGKDRIRDRNLNISNCLTVEHGHLPGQNFQRKVLNSFKIQSHHMFYDTSHNSSSTVLTTLHSAFSETASKMWAYARSLRPVQRPSPKLVIRTIAKTVDVAHLILTSKSRKTRYPEYQYSISKQQLQTAAFSAFIETLGRKQTKYMEVLTWLRLELHKVDPRRSILF